MAVTGKAIIAPETATDVGITHHMSDLVVEVPTGQDGVWSNPSVGSRVSDIHVDGGGGTNNFGFRIGGTSTGAHGLYRGLSITGADNGLQLLHVDHVNVVGLDINAPKRHGIWLSSSDECNILGPIIDTPSFSNNGVYSGIYVDGLSYRNRVSETLMPDNGTAWHSYAVEILSGYDNQIGPGSLFEGDDGMFSDSSYGNNDFGLNVTTYSLATVIDTTGEGLLHVPFAQDATVYAIDLRLKTAATGSAVILDVNKNGTTIFPTTTKPTLATTTVEAVAYPDTLSINAGNVYRVDVDQADSNGVAEGLTVNVLWRAA